MQHFVIGWACSLVFPFLIVLVDLIKGAFRAGVISPE